MAFLDLIVLKLFIKPLMPPNLSLFEVNTIIVAINGLKKTQYKERKVDGTIEYIIKYNIGIGYYPKT